MARKTNEQYWREREEAHIKAGLKTDKELRLAERKRFSILQRDIEKEINDFYARYAKTEGISIVEARKRASAIDMAAYEAKAKKYVKNRTFSKQANQEMRLYNMTMKVNRLELLKSNIGLRLVDAYQDIEIDYDDTLSSAVRNEFERLSGILGETVHANEAHVKDIVNASFHNASFSDRIWRDQNLLKAELDIMLTRGIVQGKHPSVLARDLTGIIDVSRMSAERLLVTELARVQTAAQKQSFEDCGYEKYVYIAEPTACPVCKALDNGKGYPVKLMMSGKNAPPMHCWCRCSTAAYADREALEARLAEIEAQESKNQPKSIVKSEGSGTMEMYRKVDNSRKGLKFISDKTFEDLTISARKQGATIMRGTQEVERHLDKMGAAASNIGDVLLFRKDVCISEVLEETRHFEQNLEKLNNDKSEPLRTILNEIEAKKYVLDNAQRYKVPRNEVELTQNQLESYKKQLAELEGRESDVKNS